jgi:hypothetical protein
MWRPKKRRGRTQHGTATEIAKPAAQLDPEIQRRFEMPAAEIRMRSGRIVEEAITIGRILTNVKSEMPHGCWLPWLASEFNWGEATANRVMRVYEVFGNPANVRDLEKVQADIPVSALYLLSRVSTPDAAVAKAMELAQRKKITFSEAQKLVREALPPRGVVIHVEKQEPEPPRGVVIHVEPPKPEPPRVTKFTVETETTTVHVPVIRRTPRGIETWGELRDELEQIVKTAETIEIPALGPAEALENRQLIGRAISVLQAIRDDLDTQLRGSDVAPP